MARTPSEEQKRSMDQGTVLKGNLAARNALLNDLAPGAAPSAERQQAAASLGNAVVMGTEIAADITGANTVSMVTTGKSMTGDDVGVVDALAMAPILKPLKLADNAADLNKLNKLSNKTDDVGDSAKTIQEKTPWNSSTRKKAWQEKGQPEGKAPQREVIVENRKTGEFETRTESKELHHKNPRREGGGNDSDNLQEVWPAEHEAIDEYRHIDYDVVTEIPDHAFDD